jgi:hypothetical protein
MILWLDALAVLLLNVPFGVWRSRVRRFSLAWFLSIHLPVPFVIALRYLSGLGYAWHTFPVLIGAFFLGQFIGSRAGRRWAARRATSTPQ